jgi:hypothetical protein
MNFGEDVYPISTTDSQRDSNLKSRLAFKNYKRFANFLSVTLGFNSFCQQDDRRQRLTHIQGLHGLGLGRLIASPSAGSPRRMG